MSLEHNKVHSTYYTISMHTAYENQKMSQLFDDFCCFHKKISYASNQCLYCAIIRKTCFSIQKKHLNLLYGIIEFVHRMQASQEKKLTFLNGQMVTNKMYCDESNGFGIVVSFLWIPFFSRKPVNSENIVEWPLYCTRKWKIMCIRTNMRTLNRWKCG